MNCKKIAELTSDYIDDCLPVATRKQIDAHTSACPACAALVEEMRDMLHGLRSLSGRTESVDCWGGVRERILCAEIERRPWARLLLRPVIAAPALAAASLALVLAILPMQTREPVGQDPASFPGYATYVSAHSGAQRQQAFADPDVVFIAAELEKADVSNGPTRQ